MARVTIGIPTVSRIEFLGEALQSLASQTYRDFEVVIGDNSASAGYAARVDALAAAFPQLAIRVHHHARDLGMTGNAQFLAEAGRSEFWIYLPDDDRFLPDCLATLVAALDAEPRAGVAFSDHVLIDSRGRVDHAASEMNSRQYGRAALRPGFHPASRLFELALAQVFELQSMLFRQTVISALGFRQSAALVPDFDLQLRLWQAPMEGAVYCAERLNEYRVHGTQATGSGDIRAVSRAIIAAIEDAAPRGAENGRLYRRRLATHHGLIAMHEAEAGNRDLAMRHARQSRSFAPLSPRAWAVTALALCPPTLARTARAALRRARSVLRAS
jgi:GT2 family glycosyltransferase